MSSVYRYWLTPSEKRAAIFLVAVFVALYTLYSYSNLKGHDPSNKCRHYIAVIDAGSSGSRIQIFCKELNHIRPLNLMLKTYPGISSFKKIREAGRSLTPLFDFLEFHIPPSLLYTTRVALRATAGVRLMPKEKQNKLMMGLEDYVRRNREFILHARVISGEEEAKFGWTAAQALTGHKHVGVVDLGGASTQISFLDERKVFVRSLLGYGVNQIYERYITEALKKNADPCLPQGYSHMKNGNLIHGNGKHAVCLERLRRFFSGDEMLDKIRNDVSKRWGKMKAMKEWFALDNYEITQKLLMIPNRSTLTDWKDASASMCENRQWPPTDQTCIVGKCTGGYGEYREIKHSMMCFVAAYTTILLEDTYGIDVNTAINFVTHVNGSRLEWAYGFAIQEFT